MPILLLNGFMTIVAHTDDDLLFMNPDIATSIADGNVATTVFVTAGDAGLDDWYWQGREEGIKAAYAVMAGEDDWVDEVVPIEQNGAAYNIASSFLESAPEVRLYFMRIPDGGGFIEDPLDFETLARLEDGTRLSVDTIDEATTYTRADVVNVLAGLMEAHDPTAFRLQVAEGDGANGEHTDHVHATEFALEAMDEFSGDTYSVAHYVNYQTETLAPNLTPEEAAYSMEIMQAYAAHDPAVLDADGNLLPIYVAWTMRQYVDETYVVSDNEPDTDSSFSLGDEPDNFYFEIDPQTGELTPKDWFTANRTDAWDEDEDFIYNVTRITTPSDGSPATTELLRYEEQSVGPLVLLGDADVDDGPEDDGPAEEDPSEDDPIDDDPTDGDPEEDAPVEDEPDDEGPADEDPQPAQSSFYLGDHPDNFYFNIDTETGEITTKGWFSPSLLDAWDADEDYIYDVTRIETPNDGGPPTTELVQYDTEAEGVLTILDESSPTGDPDVDTDPMDDDTDPTDSTEDDTTGEDPADDDPTGDDPASDDPTPTLTYQLSGSDAFLFEMDSTNGDISTKDWFVPDFSDPWDQDENNIYEITRTGFDQTDTVASREFIRYEVLRTNELILVSSDDDILLPLMGGYAEDSPDQAELDDVQELLDA